MTSTAEATSIGFRGDSYVASVDGDGRFAEVVPAFLDQSADEVA